MSDYILDVKSQTSKVDWAFPFQRTGPFPLDRSSVFSSLEDAQNYASGAADERQLSGSSYIGQIISVYTIENEVPTVGAYIIDPARTLMKLAATTASGDLSSDIIRLEQLINGKASTDYVNQELNKKANSDSVYSKIEVETYVAQQIANAGHLKRVVVEQLPDVSTTQANTIYMIKKTGGGIASWGKNIYEEYMVIEGEWELLGNSQIDLTDYAKISDIPTRVSQLTNDSNYLTEHQDISGKLDADKLPEAINIALAQAKESGEFDGKNGYNPIRGIDYWTGSDIAEIKSYVDDAILGGEW